MIRPNKSLLGGFTLALLSVVFASLSVFLGGCGQAEKKQSTVEAVLVAPDGTTMPMTADNVEDALRASIGMPSKAEEAKATKYLEGAEGDLEDFAGAPCLYVAHANEPTFLDPQGKLWTGLNWDGGYFPVLGRQNGFIKTVMREHRADHTVHFKIIYFRDGHLIADWRQTVWGQALGSYNVEEQVPELCVIPPEAKKPPQNNETAEPSAQSLSV